MKTKTKSIVGILMSSLVILFMLFDVIMKFIQPKEVVETTLSLGFQQEHIVTIGVLGFAVTLLYAIPKTSLIGMILMTGYFGGAIAINFRMDHPLFSHILFPIYLATLAWGGLLLRYPALKTHLLNPTKSQS